MQEFGKQRFGKLWLKNNALLKRKLQVISQHHIMKLKGNIPQSKNQPKADYFDEIVL